MGVDSNVLIFERIKEELEAQRGVRAAINAGFSRVFLTLVDTHTAALISAAFLFQFGTGPIRGFAVDAVLRAFVESVYIDLRLEDAVRGRTRQQKSRDDQHLAFMHIFKDTNYNFLRWRWHALGLSSALVLAGAIRHRHQGDPAWRRVRRRNRRDHAVRATDQRRAGPGRHAAGLSRRRNVRAGVRSTGRTSGHGACAVGRRRVGRVAEPGTRSDHGRVEAGGPRKLQHRGQRDRGTHCRTGVDAQGHLGDGPVDGRPSFFTSACASRSASASEPSPRHCTTFWSRSHFWRSSSTTSASTSLRPS